MRKTFIAISRFEGDGSLKVRELNEIRSVKPSDLPMSISTNSPQKRRIMIQKPSESVVEVGENYSILPIDQPNERRRSAPLTFIKPEQVARRISQQPDSHFYLNPINQVYSNVDKSFKPYHLRSLSTSKDQTDNGVFKLKHYQEGAIKTDLTEERTKRRQSRDIQKTCHDFYENPSDSNKRNFRKTTTQALNGRQVVIPNLSSSLAIERTSHLRVGSESMNRQKNIPTTGGAMSSTYNGVSPQQNKHFQNREPAQVATYILGGFDLVDYTDTINKLHKKLLRKILINK